jgi:hypothetical protein
MKIDYTTWSADRLRGFTPQLGHIFKHPEKRSRNQFAALFATLYGDELTGPIVCYSLYKLNGGTGKSTAHAYADDFQAAGDQPPKFQCQTGNVQRDHYDFHWLNPAHEAARRQQILDALNPALRVHFVVVWDRAAEMLCPDIPPGWKDLQGYHWMQTEKQERTNAA